MDSTREKGGGGLSRVRRMGLVAGPAAFALLALLPAPGGLGAAGWRVAAVGVWMAVRWMSEAVPLAVTALLPLLLFPLLGTHPASIPAFRTASWPTEESTVHTARLVVEARMRRSPRFLG